jgi:hypothetical protein
LAQQAQAESIQRLLNRIEQLEKQDTERAASTQSVQKQHQDEIKTHEERAQALVSWIAELETKVSSLQAGRVLPEIALAADDAPTTRELDQKIRIVERNNELAAEAAEARAKESPRLSVGASGFALSSADTNRVEAPVSCSWIREHSSMTTLSNGNDSFQFWSRAAHSGSELSSAI